MRTDFQRPIGPVLRAFGGFPHPGLHSGAVHAKKHVAGRADDAAGGGLVSGAFNPSAFEAARWLYPAVGTHSRAAVHLDERTAAVPALSMGAKEGQVPEGLGGRWRWSGCRDVAGHRVTARDALAVFGPPEALHGNGACVGLPARAEPIGDLCRRGLSLNLMNIGGRAPRLNRDLCRHQFKLLRCSAKDVAAPGGLAAALCEVERPFVGVAPLVSVNEVQRSKRDVIAFKKEPTGHLNARLVVVRASGDQYRDPQKHSHDQQGTRLSRAA